MTWRTVSSETGGASPAGSGFSTGICPGPVEKPGICPGPVESLASVAAMRLI